jgi:hypothetical protein
MTCPVVALVLLILMTVTSFRVHRIGTHTHTHTADNTESYSIREWIGVKCYVLFLFCIVIHLLALLLAVWYCSCFMGLTFINLYAWKHGCWKCYEFLCCRLLMSFCGLDLACVGNVMNVPSLDFCSKLYYKWVTKYVSNSTSISNYISLCSFMFKSNTVLICADTTVILDGLPRNVIVNSQT